MSDVKTGYVPVEKDVKLYYEDTGEGAPIVFVHEFGGDYRSWEHQARYLTRRFRVVTFNARGFPPSDCPKDASYYGFDIAVEDIGKVLDHLKIEKAHLVGYSMGSFTALFFALRHPDRARSISVVGCGYGAESEWGQIHRDNVTNMAADYEQNGMDSLAATRYTIGATRVQQVSKDPRGWIEFDSQFREHDPTGSAHSLREVIAPRPSMLDHEDDLKNMTVPLMVLTGDEDWQCLLPGVFMKKTSPTCSLCVIPNSGHGINLEEPALFNQTLNDFYTDIELGRWRPRDPRAFAAQNLQAADEDLGQVPRFVNVD